MILVAVEIDETSLKRKKKFSISTVLSAYEFLFRESNNLKSHRLCYKCAYSDG